MTNDLKLFSISHQRASVLIREKFSLNDLETKHFLQKLNEVLSINEAIVLSTCNRTEIYYCSKDNRTLDILKLLCAFKCLVPSDKYAKYINVKEGDQAVKHLFTTGIGLNSLLLGDLQIYGQLKAAYQYATDENMCQAFLHRLMHTFFHFHKRVVNETDFKKGITSNSYTAANIIHKRSLKLSSPKILIVGLGEMGSNVCQYLSKIGTKNVWVTNRSMKKAKDISKTYGFNSIDYGIHYKKLQQFDIILSCAHQENLIYKITHFGSKSPDLIIDLCTPRTVSPEITRLGTKVLNVDDLGLQIDHTIQSRKKEIAKIEKIVMEELSGFNVWLTETTFTPTVQKLKQALEELRIESLATFKKELNASELDAIDKVSNKMIQKIVQLPTLQLKEACKQGNVATLNDALKALFMLEEPTVLTSKL